MSEALPPCPYVKKGRHSLNAIIPEDDGHPMVLFCDACGMTLARSLAVPAPLDDMTADEIRRLSQPGTSRSTD
jgi:hypothetical protein